MERRQRRSRLAMGQRADQRADEPVVADRAAVAQRAGDLLERARRGSDRRRKLVGAEDRVDLDVALHRPDAGEARAAVVDRQAAGDRRLRDVDHQVRGTRLVGRRLEDAGGADAGNVVGQKQRALDRAEPGRPRQHRVLQIAVDVAPGLGVAALHRDAAEIALDHVDGEDAVAHALRRHIGAHEQIALGAIGGLDLVGDVEDVAQRDVLAEQPGIERPETVRGNLDRAHDLDVAQLEAHLVHRARHGGAVWRDDAEIEIGLRRRRRALPVAAGLHRARQHLRASLCPEQGRKRAKRCAGASPRKKIPSAIHQPSPLLARANHGPQSRPNSGTTVIYVCPNLPGFCGCNNYEVRD